MFMSLNSLDSKISPHSLHSTNSDSSSRLTICTRGCLHGCFLSTLCGVGDGLEVIDPDGRPMKCGWGQDIAGIFGILKLLGRLSSPDVLDVHEFSSKALRSQKCSIFRNSNNFARTRVSHSLLDTYR